MALTQVSTKGLKDGTITTVDLADDAVTGAKIDGATITGANIANDTIGAAKLQAGIINNSKIASDAAIAGTKISPDFGSQIIASTGQLQLTSQIPAFFKRSVTGASPVTVLIGNNTQSYALEASSTGFSINDYTNINVPRLAINSSGLIGIGTTVPSELLTINGADQSTLIRTSNATGSAKLKFEADGTNYAGIGLENTSLVFRCSNSSTPTSRMTIAADGLVTVSGDLAVTSSLAKIKLNDSDGGDQYQIRNDAGSFIIRNGTDSKSVLTIDGACVTSLLNATPPATGVSVLHVSNSGSATTLGTAATFRVSNNGGNGAYSVFEAESSVGSIRLGNDGQFYVTGASTFTNDIRVDRGSAIDGLLGQAYAGYFGLIHADQTINQEYMIISASTHTFISAGTGAGVYIRPSANSVTHETFFGINHTQFNTNVLMNSHNILRNDFAAGFLVGAQNSQGASDAKTNPIFTIGTNHMPNNTSLVDMYGIGYSNGNASFTPSGAGWGMYVAADGDSRIYLDGSYGNIHLQDTQGSVIFANDGWSGDRSTGKIQTYAGHLYMQNASNSGAFAFRLPNGTEPYKINANGTVTTSDRRLKKDITTITGAVDTVKQLIGRSFTWKEGDTKSFGIIAQEVETILPEIISTQTVIEGEENDDPYKMVNYAAFTGHFIEAIKELAAKIEALETEVATLKAS